MTPLTIHQPAPCHENWEAMTPTDLGRHCAACRTQVVDFTHMTDDEVRAFVRHTTPGRRCGRFREDQVGRPLFAAAVLVTGGRRWATAAVLLLGSMVGLKARAQAGKPAATGEPPKPSAVSNPRPGSADGGFFVQGVVRNRWGVRQEGVRVRARGVGDTTDARGYFRLLVPQTKRGTIRYIVVNYRNPRHEKIHLAARVPFDSTRTDPYRIRLKKAPVVRNPGFY